MLPENLLRQSCRYDCVSKVLENALMTVFGRGNVPMSALRIIYRYSIDTNGTSKEAIKKIATKLSKIPEIYINQLDNDDVSSEQIFTELEMGRSVVVPVWLKHNNIFGSHAVTAIAIQGKRICIFDPAFGHSTQTLKSLNIGSTPIIGPITKNHHRGRGQYTIEKNIFTPFSIGKSLVHTENKPKKQKAIS